MGVVYANAGIEGVAHKTLKKLEAFSESAVEKNIAAPLFILLEEIGGACEIFGAEHLIATSYYQTPAHDHGSPNPPGLAMGLLPGIQCTILSRKK